MTRNLTLSKLLLSTIALGTSYPVVATPFVFSTGNPDGLVATASRPSADGKAEIETADDFVLSQATRINSGTFTGLFSGAGTPTVKNVIVEIYRVFPFDSVNPPSGKVPTRVNSPSDIAFLSRDASAGELSFTTTALGSFTAANSVINGINPSPGEFTGGEGPVTGLETQFSFSFSTPLQLAAGHYFFVPQIELSSGDFLWLSAAKPIVAPGTAFLPDLQSWIRNEALQPDWLRIGTDITHQGPFNAAFSLQGAAVPEPSTWAMMIAGFGALGCVTRRRRAARALVA